MKIPWIRIVITVLIWVGLTIYKNYFMPLDENMVAIGQVENSDSSYTNWQAWKAFSDYFWVLYLLPLLMFINLLFKKQ